MLRKKPKKKWKLIKYKSSFNLKQRFVEESIIYGEFLIKIYHKNFLKILTFCIKGVLSSEPNRGTRLKKLMATGKNPLNRAKNP